MLQRRSSSLFTGSNRFYIIHQINTERFLKEGKVLLIGQGIDNNGQYLQIFEPSDSTEYVVITDDLSQIKQKSYFQQNNVFDIAYLVVSNILM